MSHETHTDTCPACTDGVLDYADDEYRCPECGARYGAASHAEFGSRGCVEVIEPDTDDRLDVDPVTATLQRIMAKLANVPPAPASGVYVEAYEETLGWPRW